MSPTQARVAICHGSEAPFSFADATLDAIRDNEVLVRIVACGICHTDLAVRDAQLPVPLPAVLGHEGVGIVEQVGAAVTRVAAGDRVVLSFNSCGECLNCRDQAPTYCYRFFPFNWSGSRPDGAPTMTLGDRPLNANFFGQSSFATHAIASERNVVVLPAHSTDVPLEVLAPLGCGLMTGAGAVLRSMAVRAGRPIAVFGTGTVGLAAIMAARIAGADPIVAVDINDARLALARELGATHAFNVRDEPAERIRALCPDGLAYALDTTGRVAVIEDAWSLLAPKGVCGIVGASSPADELRFNEAAFMGGGRRVIGILGGDSDLQTFLPELVDHYLAGRFPFDRLIRFYPFDQINEAIHASESGEVIKPVLRMTD